MGDIARNFGALVAFFGMCGAALFGITTLTDPPQKVNPPNKAERVNLNPCPTEDSDNCYRLNGGKDGIGHSFVVIDGVVYILGN